jgi:hypothetical protein
VRAVGFVTRSHDDALYQIRMHPARFEQVVSAPNVRFKGRQRIPMGDAHNGLGRQMNHRVNLVFVQRAFQARKVLDVALHERDLPVIARTIKAGLRIGVAHQRNHARAGGDQIFHQPKADHARRAAERGRTLSFGIRLHIVVRETAEEAWRDADALIRHVDDEAITFSQRTFARFDSVGQQRMTRLHNGRRDKLEISPNLWAGVGLVRGGAGTALVGSHEQVADRIAEYHELGIDEFILSGYPHLEEAYAFGEGVLPVLLERGLVDERAPVAP